ncbi:MAG: M24 family metallopeptidase [Syntrophobacteraceae bacterium]
MDRDPFAARLLRFRKLMEEQSIDAFLVAVPENRYYLSGYEAEDLQPSESSGYLLITQSSQSLLTDFRYKEAAQQEAPDFDLIIYGEGLAQVLPDLFLTFKVKKVGIEKDYLSFRKYLEVRDALLAACGADAEVAAPEDFTEKLRVVKEPMEIERIKNSLALTEKALSEVWDIMKPGMREKDIAWEIERRIREGGGEAVSFPPIVAAGPNGALPHAVPTDRLISQGDAVILDLGSKLNHYCSDMTRTWFAGAPEKKLQEIYRIVRDAQSASQDAVRAGKESMEIDAVARDVIRQAGYGDNFGHGLGHGVGLAVHERPGLRSKTSSMLDVDMVVTIEPGIYLPGYGGVRLENMVRITGTGCEVLNRKDLFYRW